MPVAQKPLVFTVFFVAALFWGCVRDGAPPVVPDDAPVTRAEPLTAAGPEETPDVAALDAGAGEASLEAPPVPVIEPVCSADMKLVEGNYCPKVEQLCLHGSRLVPTGKTYTVAGVTRPMMTGKEYWCKDGCVPEPMDVCYEFVPNHSPCVSVKQVAGADGATVTVPDERPMRFCIDTYEWPNVVGELPRVMVSWYEAKQLCEASGKRLCDDTEWTLACEGPERLPYPYGWVRDDTLCNIDNTFIAWNAKKLFSGDPQVAAAELERLSQREPIGQRTTCVSPYGVFDLTGNVDEWANHVTGNGHPHVSVFKGGHWVRGIRNRCRPKTSSHGPEFAFYAEGFRCCADAASSAP